MARYLQYTFPPANTQDVCSAQTFGGAATFLLNGNFVNIPQNGVSFLIRGYSRTVSVTANENGVNVTVIGTQNGVIVSEIITTIAATTVYGAMVFDTITSVTADAAITNAMVGTGHSGFFPLITVNLDNHYLSYALSTAKETTNSIPTTIYNTLADIPASYGMFTYTNWTTNFSLFNIKAINADNQFFLPLANMVACRFILIQISGSGATINNSISMKFTQVI